MIFSYNYSFECNSYRYFGGGCKIDKIPEFKVVLFDKTLKVRIDRNDEYMYTGEQARVKFKKEYNELLEEIKTLPPTKKTKNKASKKIKKFLIKSIKRGLIVSESEYNRLMSPGGIGPNFSTNSFVKT